MKNSDMPAMPQSDEWKEQLAKYYRLRSDRFPASPPEMDGSGLTKLEDFTKAAMQGLLAYGDLYLFSSKNRAKLAKDAVDFAEAVLAELEARNNG